MAQVVQGEALDASPLARGAPAITHASHHATTEVAALKAQGDGGEVGVTGSISVVHALMRANLVDEYRLFVYPVLSGRGRNLMPSGSTAEGLRLTDCTSFRSGVVLQVYTTP